MTPLAAERLAESQLALALPQRWRHVAGVARTASQMLLGNRLVSAAWLHDIGYSPYVVDTGFHPLDGARWLRRRGVDEGVVNLVAHHSCAKVEADLRGLADDLVEEFPFDSSLEHQELCFCDLTTSPDGTHVTPAERLAEIRRRYPDGHVVRRFIDLAESDLLETACKVASRLRPVGRQSR